MQRLEAGIGRLSAEIALPVTAAAQRHTEALAAAEQRLAAQMADIFKAVQSPAVRETDAPLQERLAHAIADIRKRQVELARIEAGRDEDTAAEDDTRHAIIAQLALLSQKLDAALAAPASPTGLTDVLSRLDKIDSRFDESARLEHMVRHLAESVEALHKAPPQAQGGLDSLAEQIAGLGKRLEAMRSASPASADDGRISAIEQAVDALCVQLRSLPQADEARLETLARAAPREALATLGPQATGADEPLGQRTGDTLDAVHRALERVADRLAALEENATVRAPIAMDQPEKRAAAALAAAMQPLPEAVVQEGPEDLLARANPGLTENVGFTASFIAAARRAAMAAADETRAFPHDDSSGTAEHRRRSLLIGVGALAAAAGAATLAQQWPGA